MAARSDAGQVGGERGERSAWGRSDDESGRAGRAQRTQVGGRRRPGPVRGGLDRFRAVWAGLDRSGPVQTVWTGSSPAGRSRRSGPGGIGPVWAGLDRVMSGSDLNLPGLGLSGRPGLV